MIRKIARPMLASVYIADGADTVLNADSHMEGTQQVVSKVRAVLPRQYAIYIPKDPATVTKAIGATKVGAGSLLALGKMPRTSAAVLALMSIPTILARHAFWETQDKEEKIVRRQGFLTSIALLGGLAITSVDTAGKPGLKWRANKAAERANKQIQQALPTRSETEKFADSAKESASAIAATAGDLFGDAKDKLGEYATTVQDYVDDNKDDWFDTASDAASSARQSFAQATGFLKDNGSQWLEQASKDSKVAKKKVVKAAHKAQQRAAAALEDAEKSSGKAAKKAQKRAEQLQGRAEKAVAKAQKKIEKKF